MSTKTAFTIFVGTDIWGTAPAIGSEPAIALARAIERSTRADPNRGVIEMHADWLDIPFARIENGGAVTHRVDAPEAKLAGVNGCEPVNCDECCRPLTEEEGNDCYDGPERPWYVCAPCRARVESPDYNE